MNFNNSSAAILALATLQLVLEMISWMNKMHLNVALRSDPTMKVVSSWRVL